MRTVQKEEIQRVIARREANSYKGDFGRLLLIGGTYPYGGAIIMAALAAVHSGAGLVTVATNPDNLTALHSHLPKPWALIWQITNSFVSKFKKPV